MTRESTDPRQPGTPVDQSRASEHVSDLSRGAWRDVLKRTFKEYKADNLTDLAAALTYYGVLAIFPMLIVLISILGLIGHSATQPLIENLGKVAPGPAREIFTSAIKNVQSGKGTTGILFIVGLAGGLWSASAYIAGFMRASNIVWDVAEEAHLEDHPTPSRRDPGDRSAAHRERRRGGADRRPGKAGGGRDRCRKQRGHDLGHR